MHLTNHHHVQLGFEMLLNAYYFIRPMIPHAVRFAVRHASAIPIKAACVATWPINVASRERAERWPGWPNGKSFAFVLTHDVESSTGLHRCEQLATLEMRLGLRSTFNFVPEGGYHPSQALRAFLETNGFEIGVHDLHHDGSLYRSRRTFEGHAAKINHYLKAWNAVGFRSAFMRHNLEWLKQLNVLYDASTFDTDPFEPQPDGMNTIFPFWVSHRNGGGYVELPYTLAQDSTLFLVLRERGNDIWKRKLDWVAAHGGMALLNVHPDYMTFDGPGGRSEYRAELYEDLLQYALGRWGDKAWFATCREVAEHAQRHVDCLHTVSV